ncbi:MAG: hypothetical protein QOH41_4129 [Blastocatellia bacterium]|jgi:hypothetical protein|nr:hypothetical protein [Blastocatellia bacterium]
MGRNKKLALILVLGCGIVCLIVVSGARSNSRRATLNKATLLSPPNGFQRAREQNGRPSSLEDIKKRFPKIDYDAPEPTDPAERSKRRNKGKHYDNGYLSKEPTHYSSGLVSEWDLNLPALPVAQSNAVVIGKTLSGGAFLSNDKTGVYTELSAKIEEVLSTDKDSVTKGKVIDLSRMGGVVRYGTGEESLFHIVGQNMPTVAKRYLFFLKAIPDSQDFEIITAYELGSLGVTALDAPGQFTHYNGLDEATFLDTVRTVVSEKKKQS